MQIAVLADIHGNLPALLAVLAEIDDDPVDAIVVAGDAVGGPLVAETLTALEERPEPVYWIAGNCEREAFAVHGGAPADDDESGRAASGAPGRSTTAGTMPRSPRPRSPASSRAFCSVTAHPGATTRSSPGPRPTRSSSTR